MENVVELEIEKNKFLIIEKSKALEYAVIEYFKNGRQVKIDGKEFDVFNYGNQELVYKMQ